MSFIRRIPRLTQIYSIISPKLHDACLLYNDILSVWSKYVNFTRDSDWFNMIQKMDPIGYNKGVSPLVKLVMHNKSQLQFKDKFDEGLRTKIMSNTRLFDYGRSMDMLRLCRYFWSMELISMLVT